MIKSKHLVWLLEGLGVFFLVLGFLLVQQSAPVAAQDNGTPQPTGDDSFCLTCHGDTNATTTLADGTVIHIGVDRDMLDHSVHGTGSSEGALGCVDCHGTDIFPHDKPLPADARGFRVEMSLVCTRCHADQTANLADGVHYSALMSGNLTAATCVDCHGSHDIQTPNEPRTRISETCGNCHEQIFNQYKDSVHGQALFEGDPNVPTCIDCHGVHGIQHPTTSQFRNRSPELCAGCHANAELMSQYGITTNVFNSYLTEFHGTTVALFDQTDPNVPSNKAVCFDCHGVHNIQKVDAANSQVVRNNLLATCQKCHPSASADFPDAWVGHFPPSLQTQPLMYVVNLFYTILIPVVLAGFIFLILTDIFRRIRDRVGRGGSQNG